jgi:hypothetical protein
VPGAGKTSFIQAIAGHCNRSISYLQIDPEMTDVILRSAMEVRPSRPTPVSSAGEGKRGRPPASPRSLPVLHLPDIQSAHRAGGRDPVRHLADVALDHLEGHNNTAFKQSLYSESQSCFLSRARIRAPVRAHAPRGPSTALDCF